MANLVCFKCLKVFATIKLLWKHLRNTHQITTKSKTRVVCGNCSQVYYTGYGYKRHLQAHLDDGPVANPLQGPPNLDLENANIGPDDDGGDLDNAEDNENNELDAPRSKAQIVEDVKEAMCAYVSH